MINNLNDKYQEIVFDSLLANAAAVTQSAAIAAYEWIGKGNEKAADQAAVSAMRTAFNMLYIDGTVVIGEGERDQAPMLYIGEKLGLGGIPVDIAVDPLEGTTICADGTNNSISVLAISKKGGLLHAPDVYMEKIVVGANLPDYVVDLDNTYEQNLKNLAKAKQCNISDLNIMILKRARHEEMISKIREAGARIHLINDGDIIGAIATTGIVSTKVDMYLGIGGAPEGVIAAAALKCLNGQMQARLIFNEDKQIAFAKKIGLTDLNKKYCIDDMAKEDVIFIATGVTDGLLLKGIKKYRTKFSSNTILISSKQQLMQKIHTFQL